MHSDDIQPLIDIENIPTLPAIAIEAMRLMEGEHSSFDSVAELLQNDQVLTSRVLHYANSAAVSVKEVTSISEAIARLGFNTVRSIILSATIFDSFSTKFAREKDKLIRFWLHSIGVATTAEILAQRLGFSNTDEAYTAGLLHDIGKLICYLQQPEQFAQLCQELTSQGSFATQGNAPLELEGAFLATNHLEAGRAAAEHWQLPALLADAIWLHHQPVSASITPDDHDLAALIRFADVLCVSHHIGASYFLTDGPYCHEHFHFALENLVRNHEMAPDTVEDMLQDIHERLQHIGDVLGFWDEVEYQKLISSANTSLGAISIDLDQNNRALSDANRVLAATCTMTRGLQPGMTLHDSAAVITRAAAEAFQISSCICLIRDPGQQAFAGQLLQGNSCYRLDIPSHLAALEEHLSQGAAESAIEDAALQRLQQTTLELARGAALENCMVKLLAGSHFLATFFLSENPKLAAKDRILGELVADFAEPLDPATPGAANLQHNFEAFARTTATIVERILLENLLDRQAKKLAEASRKMEENQRQLFHSHRLATVGQLAAGAAHEINNPLTIISLNIQILNRLLQAVEDNEPIKERLATISGQERRISKIIQDLMGFARPGQPKFQPSSIAEIAGKVLAVIGDRVSMTKITVANQIDADLPMVMVDPLQIEQVIMNLLINANHAMPDGGSLTLQSKVRKNVVEISVTDTGTGIDPKHLSKIFDPFFTTKKQGEGTGLGLAICNSIVEHNGGLMRVESKLGQGTTFTISLPIDKGSRLRAMKLAVDKKKAVSSGKAKEAYRILVIDDEHLLNDMLQETLRAAGYEVDGAYDGVEGLGLLRYKKYDLILLDIRMPRKDGLEVLQFVKEEYPQIKVVIITGLATRKEIEETVSMGAFACLKKPFQLDKVMATIDKALGKS